MYLNTRTAFPSATFSLYFPSTSVVTPVVVPLIKTLTPIKGSPFSSVTLPLTLKSFLYSEILPMAAAETSEERQSCFSDAFRVCWAAIPNRDDVFHCLMDNRPRLNPACGTVMDQYRREHRVRRASRNARAD